MVRGPEARRCSYKSERGLEGMRLACFPKGMEAAHVGTSPQGLQAARAIQSVAHVQGVRARLPDHAPAPKHHRMLCDKYLPNGEPVVQAASKLWQQWDVPGGAIKFNHLNGKVLLWRGVPPPETAPPGAASQLPPPPGVAAAADATAPDLTPTVDCFYYRVLARLALRGGRWRGRRRFLVLLQGARVVGATVAVTKHHGRPAHEPIAAPA